MDKPYKKRNYNLKNNRMDALKLSQDVRKILHEQGWKPNTNHTISDVKEIWKQKKYSVSESGIIFMKNFSGFKLIHDSYSGQSKDYSIFDGIKATQGIHSSWVTDDYQQRINKNLIPIGLGYSEHLTYFIAEDYSIYGGFDGDFSLIGDSINSFFENILFHKNFQKID